MFFRFWGIVIKDASSFSFYSTASLSPPFRSQGCYVSTETPSLKAGGEASSSPAATGLAGRERLFVVSCTGFAGDSSLSPEWLFDFPDFVASAAAFVGDPLSSPGLLFDLLTFAVDDIGGDSSSSADLLFDFSGFPDVSADLDSPEQNVNRREAKLDRSPDKSAKSAARQPPAAKSQANS